MHPPALPGVVAALAVVLFSSACDPKRVTSEQEPVAAQAIALREAPDARVLAASLAGATLDATARAALTDEMRVAVDGSRLPVLVPRGLVGRGRLLVEEHWYDFAYRSGETKLHVKGIGVAHTSVPFPQPNAMAGRRPVFVNRSEEITSVSFQENGIHYDAYLECGGRKCEDAAELTAFVADLALVGGGVR